MTKLSELATLIGGVHQGADPEISAIMPLEWAGPSDISFFANPKYLAAAQTSRAAALIAAAPVEGSSAALLIHPNPYLASAKLARHFFAPAAAQGSIHASAVIGEGVTLGANVVVGALAVVERGASVGDGARIGAQCFVGADAQIGAGATLHPGARVLERCQIGARCVLNAGCVIGGDGFGFAEDTEAADGERRVKIPQLGIVILEDDVEIGANATIDRATFGATHLGRGTKIDNLVQIAHNVVTGPDCVIVAQAGVSGSTKLGKRVILGGQVGVIGHIKLADDTQVAAQSGVMKSSAPGSTLGGSPAQAASAWMRELAALRRLDEMRKRLFAIQKTDSTKTDKKEPK